MIRVTLASSRYPPFTVIRTVAGITTQIHVHAAPAVLAAPGGVWRVLARLTACPARPR